MAELTKERLKALSNRENVGAICSDEISAMARQLLASMEQEPVACIDRANMDYLESGAGADVWPASEADSDDVLLYAAPQLPQPAPKHKAAVATLESKGYIWHGGQFWKPPIGKAPAYITGEKSAPALSADLLHMAASAIEDLLTSKDRTGEAVWYDVPAQLRRAAMLQGAEPVSQSYTLPTQGSEVVNEAAWKLFNMLTEHGPLNGHQFNNLKDCFYEALKVAMRNTAAPQRELNESAGLACKCRSGEKQQVMQAGWVAVPVEPTEDMLDEFDSIIDYGAEDSKEAWSRLIAAAPQQEVSSKIQQERERARDEMAMGARLTKHRFKP